VAVIGPGDRGHDPQEDEMTMTPNHEKRGPAGPGPLLPGRRSTVMVVVERPDPEEALLESMDWVQAFERDCGLVMDPEATELYGVAKASDLKDNLRPPRDGAVAEYLDFICVEGVWLHPGDCPMAPPDSNGAPAWAWAYYQAVMGLDDGAFCTIWDVMPLPMAA
jgi:hypothetical protein